MATILMGLSTWVLITVVELQTTIAMIITTTIIMAQILIRN